MSVVDDALDAASEAGLRYVSDELPGIRRVRRGRGFSYVDADGRTVTDPKVRARIDAIVIPPAWTDVWICAKVDGHIQATGRDARGRKQYRYHTRWREFRDANKYDRLGEFGALLPSIRTRVDRDLALPGFPREKALALVVRLLDDTLIRVGNDEYAVNNESYGLTTLLPEHVDVVADRVEFEFVGKGGLDRRVTVHDRKLAKIVRQCNELGGQELFAYRDDARGVQDVGSADVNAYLREITGAEVTAKHFRTWGGTCVAGAALALCRPPRSDGEAEKQIVGAIDVAAEVLGNTRTVCRNCYVHPTVVSAYREGELVDRWKAARATSRLDRSERMVLSLLEDSGA
jgi:DNA topoisomerase-1